MAQKYLIDTDTKRIFRVLKNKPSEAVCMIPPHNHETADADALTPISTAKAKELINMAWDNYTDTWEYDGKRFIADKTLIELGDLTRTISGDGYPHWEFLGKRGCHLYPARDLQGEWLYDKKGDVIIDRVWVGQFQGKLITYNPYHYAPQTFAWEYNPDVETRKGRGMGFIPMKHIKPVYNITDKCWL